MSACPYCGHANIPGDDICVECGHSLTPLSKPRPGSALEWKIMKKPIRDLPLRAPVTVSPETPVGEVLKRMVEKTTGCAIIEEGGLPVGIFTDRDAVLRLGCAVDELRGHPISEFMTPSPESLDIDDRIAYVIHKMDAGGYRHVPISSQGKILGVVSVREILGYLTRESQAA